MSFITSLMALFGSVLDAQSASVIQFAFRIVSASEGSTAAEIIVRRTNDLDTVVSVEFATTNLEAGRRKTKTALLVEPPSAGVFTFLDVCEHWIADGCFVVLYPGHSEAQDQDLRWMQARLPGPW
jgi:hypothetical protein